MSTRGIMATQTLTQQRQAAVDVAARSEAELAELQAERGRLSLDAMSGKPGAVKRVAEIDARLGELDRARHLADLAVAEADRRAAEAAAQERLAQRSADEAELVRLVRERDARYRAVEDLLARLAPEVEAALAAGDGVYDARIRLGHPGAPDWTGRQLFNRLCERLGPLGAGLRDLDTPPPPSRGPLVADGADRD